MKENRAGEKPVRLSFLCILPFQQFRSGSDRRQYEVKLHNRIVYTNYAVPTGALDSNSSRMLLTMLTELNERLDATILMVTHDAFSASYCRRILFIKDGKIFNELNRGNDSRKDFFAKILEVVSVLGGEQNDLV